MTTLPQKDKSTKDKATVAYHSWSFRDGLIAIIPATLLLMALNAMGIRGAVVSMVVIFGSIYLVKIIREKRAINKKLVSNSQSITEASELDKSIEQIKTKPKSNKWLGFVLVLVFISIAVAFLTSGGNPKSDKVTDNSELVSNVYRNEEHNFRIVFPEKWEIMPGVGSNILQKAESENANINVGAKRLPDGSVDRSATIKDLTSINEFKATMIEGLGEKFSDVRVTDFGETKLDNKIAYWVKYSATYSALDSTINSTTITYQLLHNGIFYSITGGTETDEYDKYYPEIQKSISSFVIES